MIDPDSLFWEPMIGQRVMVRPPQFSLQQYLRYRKAGPPLRPVRVLAVYREDDGRFTADLEDGQERIYTNWLAPLSPLEQLAEQAE